MKQRGELVCRREHGVCHSRRCGGARALHARRTAEVRRDIAVGGMDAVLMCRVVCEGWSDIKRAETAGVVKLRLLRMS